MKGMNFQEKLLPLDELPRWRARLRDAGRRLVVTNGCFDLLHLGHVTYLAAARELADSLLVGVNSDRTVRMLKGPTRPINSETDRALLLAALESVTAACIFDELRATRFLQLAHPDIYVKGGDYSREALPPEECAAVEALGGKVIVLPPVPGRSTSQLVERLRSSAPT